MVQFPKFNDHKEDGHTKISTSRMEAFSDGVLAIIITITVLGIKVPEGGSLQSLLPLLPLFLTYLISFQTIGTYWNNHHHLMLATKHISADIMWANLNLLFWLSLIPFAAEWLGRSHAGATPTAFYASILLLCGFSYTLLQAAVVKHAENREEFIQELKSSKKGLVSLICYTLAIPAAFIHPFISYFFILVVSIIWFIPDRRLERII